MEQIQLHPIPIFLPKVEGQILMNRNKDGSTSPFRLASDSLAISPDGKILFFCSTNQSAFVLDLNRSPEKQNDTGHEFTLSCGVLGRKRCV